MCFNVGVIIGPILGGILADPVHSYPDVFGPGSFLGGKDGVWWMRHWPFALPNMLSACFIFASMAAVLLGLDEVISVSLIQLADFANDAGPDA
jgi:MFS family permease